MSGAEDVNPVTPEDGSLPRYVVVDGGEPTPEQLAAIAVALTPVAVPTDDGRPSRPPAWLRAALAEAVGGRPMTTAEDLQELNL